MVDAGSEGGVGLVLAGAVAQGAFGAGAVHAWAKTRPRILGIAAASSGSLNAVIIAAGVVSDQLERATSVLEELWTSHGSWTDIAHAGIGDWLHLRGLLDTTRISKMVLEGMGQVLDGWSGKAQSPFTLTLVATNLDGRTVPGNAVPLPTYEQPMAFTAEQLLDRDSWPSIANAAAASATFPIVFSPTKTKTASGVFCIDGGAVNNAPISYLADDPRIQKIVVVTSEPQELPVTGDFGGFELLGKVADVVIHERVSFDLANAHKINQRYAAIRRALEEARVSDETRDRVLAAAGYRFLELYLIHPDAPLPGNAFSGFFHADERRRCIAAGEQAVPIRIGAATR